MRKLWDPYSKFEPSILANGLTVHASQWPEHAWQEIVVLVHSGSASDLHGREGTAHFVEHMTSQNGCIPCNDMIEFFDNHGGSVGLGMTGLLVTYYQFRLPADKSLISKGLDLFGSMHLSARLNRNLELQRRVILGEFRRKFPTPISYRVHEREWQMVFHDTQPLVGRPSALGTPESINAMTELDVQKFYDTQYVPANMSVLTLGAFRPDQIVDLIAQSPFGVMKAGNRNPPPKVAVPSPPLERVHRVSLTDEIRGLENASYRSIVALPGGFSRHAVRIATEMLNKALADDVREKRGWTYHIGCSSHSSFRACHVLDIKSRSIAPEGVTALDDVVDEHLAALYDAKANFENVKTKRFKRMYMLDCSGVNVINDCIDDLAEEDRVVSLAESQARLEKVTLDNVRDIFSILRSSRWSLIMTP